MRADRSLIPGLGAAASLVAAVACAFFVTAALIAFHGWPRVASTSTARALIVAGNSRRARAIVVSPAVARAPRAATGVTHSASRVTNGEPALVGHGVDAPRPRPILAVAPVVGPPPVPQTARPPRSISAPEGAGSAAAPVPNALAQTTQGATTTVGGVVTGLTNGLAATVGPVSPQLAGNVQSLGTGVSGAVISLGNGLARILEGPVPSR